MADLSERFYLHPFLRLCNVAVAFFGRAGFALPGARGSAAYCLLARLNNDRFFGAGYFSIWANPVDDGGFVGDGAEPAQTGL